jgi:hypothetical protein
MAPANNRDAIFDALRDRLCYATTGERIIIDAELGGESMGRMVSSGGAPTLACRIHGTEPIEAVDVVKNGEVVFTKRYLAEALEDHARVIVRFGSSSDDYGRYDYPRRARGWSGRISVRGALLEGSSLPWYHHPFTDLLMPVSDNDNAVNFRMRTRGRSRGVILDLAEASDDTRLQLWFGSGVMAPGAWGSSEEERLEFRLGDIAAGGQVYEFADGSHIDTVDAQLIPPDAALDQDFSYTDGAPAQPGDYYYLRVRQVDGSVAWSSPWMIMDQE